MERKTEGVRVWFFLLNDIIRPCYIISWWIGSRLRLLREKSDNRLSLRDRSVFTGRFDVTRFDPRCNEVRGISYYQATPAILLKQVLDKLPPEMKESTFIDIGCGKGGAIDVAANYPFTKLIGVEISPRLCELARNNLAVTDSMGRIQIVCSDATEYAYPDGPLMIYLFNPFSVDWICQFAKNLKLLCDVHQDPVFVAYYYPKWEADFLANSYFEKVGGSLAYGIYRCNS